MCEEEYYNLEHQASDNTYVFQLAERWENGEHRNAGSGGGAPKRARLIRSCSGDSCRAGRGPDKVNFNTDLFPR